MRQQVLERELRGCLNDWGDDFDVDVEAEEYHNGREFFSCVVSHKTLGEGASFSARVDGDGNCDIDMTGDDSYVPVNKGNLFALMWFEAAIASQREGGAS